jgi:hypothetical protein
MQQARQYADQWQPQARPAKPVTPKPKTKTPDENPAEQHDNEEVTNG